MDNLLPDIGAGLAGRLRSMVMVIDRLDRLEYGTGDWASEFRASELPQAATDLSLRALRVATDPVNFALLQAMASRESASIGSLMGETGLGRLVLSERLNDLVQVGLAIRLIDTDHAQATGAGAAMVTLIDQLAAVTVDAYVNSSKQGSS